MAELKNKTKMDLDQKWQDFYKKFSWTLTPAELAAAKKNHYLKERREI